MECSTPGFPVLHYLSEFAQTHVRWVSDAIYLILCHPLLLLSVLPSIRVFFSESALCIRWPKHWRFRDPLTKTWSQGVVWAHACVWMCLRMYVYKFVCARMLACPPRYVCSVHTCVYLWVYVTVLVFVMHVYKHTSRDIASLLPDHCN